METTYQISPAPKIVHDPYLEYEYQSQLSPEILALFNDAAQTYQNLVAVKVGDHMLRFTIVGGMPIETIAFDDYVMYPDVFENVDAYYSVSPGSLKEFIVINSKSAPHEFTFLLEQQNVTSQLQYDNSIIYYDLDGNELWTIQSPYSYDANNNPVDTYLNYDGTYYTVGVVPNDSIVYPLTIDPTVTYSVSSSSTMWYQDYTTGTITIRNLGPYKITVAGLNNTGLLFKLSLFSQRKIKNLTTNVETILYDNSSEYVKTWYQFFDKDGIPVSDKLDLVGVSAFPIISIAENAYYVEFTGISNSDTLYKSLNMLSLQNIQYDSNKISGIIFGQATIYSSLSSNVIPFKLPLSNYKDLADGAVVIKELYAHPGNKFSNSLGYFYTYRDQYGYWENATVSFYTEAGSLLSTNIIANPTTQGLKNTQITVPDNTNKMVFSATKRGNSLSTGYISLNHGAFVPPVTLVYPYCLEDNITAAKAVPFLNIKPGLPVKTYISVNDQSHYTETDRVNANKGDIVYVKYVRQTGDTVLFKLDGSALAVMPSYIEQLAFDTLKKITASITSIADTKRTITKLIDFYFDSKRQTATIIQNLYDSLRNTALVINLQHDTIRKTKAIYNYLFNSRRKTSNSLTAIYDTSRLAANKIAAIYDTLRKIVTSGWPFAKQIELEITVIKKQKIEVTKFKD